MAATGNGTSQFADTFASTITPLTAAYSWAFWYNPPAAAANGATIRRAFSLVNTAGGTPTGYDIGFAWSHTSASMWKAAIHREAGGTYKMAQIPTTPAFGVWIHLAATYDGTTLRIYYNGALAASTAAAVPSAVLGDPNVGVLAYNDGASGFDNAFIAELAIWQVALTAANILGLAQGVAVSATNYANVVWYNPLASVTSTVGPNLTNAGLTFNGSSFIGMTGGAAFGGDQTLTTGAYTIIMAGGPALGGNQTVTGSSYTIAMTGGLALGGDGFRASQLLVGNVYVVAQGREVGYTLR